MRRHKYGRRRFLAGACAAGIASTVPVGALGREPLLRPLPGDGPSLPAIGMGSWLTFDVGEDPAARAIRVRVLDTFFELGGSLIDSSPMYRSSEAVIGHCLAASDHGARLYSATKVWKYGRSEGIAAMEASRRLWGVERFDLMQVHNLVDWRTHLDTLREMKAEGRVRHIGITTSHGRRHADVARILASEEGIDFVQLTYNVTHRDVEKRLLPAARERDVAVIANRPLDGGLLFDAVAGRPLPGYASDIDCRNWAQIFLKFIVSHPAITCAIPATSRVDHMRENMGALYGALPDRDLRRRIVRDVERG